MRGSAGAMGGIVGYPVPARLKTSVCESSSAESRLKPDRIHHFFTTDDEELRRRVREYGYSCKRPGAQTEVHQAP
jgi:hypothetical protein